MLYLVFIWPSARFVPRSDLKCVADRVRAVRVRLKRKARVEQGRRDQAAARASQRRGRGGTLSRTSFAVPV